MTLIITLFKLTVVLVFLLCTTKIKLFFPKAGIITYWILGLLLVMLNLHGALNGITELLTGNYLMFNVANLVIAGVLFFYIGLKYFKV